MPSDISLKILSESLGNTVLVRLRSGRMLRGILQGYDQHMNLVLEQAEELSADNSIQRRLGVIVVRGDNVIMVSPTIRERSP
ncbi:MAG: RNA-binding protein [Candidatus Wolframiiraptor sp. EX4484-121]|nr:MAG: RNA-binding protein [Candidatus Wolframiiraptor sp. EX4484-121]RLE80903.1 MAG: RNA-binding protein [Thermoprotei archaeon]